MSCISNPIAADILQNGENVNLFSPFLSKNCENPACLCHKLEAVRKECTSILIETIDAWVKETDRG
jgi:hypothetical protein